MPQEDRIGVNKEWFNVAISQATNDPVLRRKTLQRLETMLREAQHVMMAIRQMQHELAKPTPFPSSPLAHALKHSRDWVLSLVISQFYVQSMNMTFVGDFPAPHPGILFNRAVEEGIWQATKDPDRRAWIHGWVQKQHA